MSVKSWFQRGKMLTKPLIVGIALLPLLLPATAHAWWVRGGWGWHGGVFVGVAPPPVVVGPPVVYPPPSLVYAPPVAYAPPPPAVVTPYRWVPGHYDWRGIWIPGHWA